MDSLIVVNNCMSFIRLPNTLSKREHFVFCWIFYLIGSLNRQYEWHTIISIISNKLGNVYVLSQLTSYVGIVVRLLGIS
jgi:hypothetical protein